MQNTQTIASISFPCSPNGHTTFAEARKIIENIPNPFPAEIAKECFAELERTLLIGALDTSPRTCAHHPGEYVCPVLISYADGREAARIVGLPRNDEFHSCANFVEDLRRFLHLADERVVVFMMDMKTSNIVKFYGHDDPIHAMYECRDALLVACVVRQAAYYGIVNTRVFDGEMRNGVDYPPVIVPLERRPDCMTFSTIRERDALLNEALKPYYALGIQTIDVPFSAMLYQFNTNYPEILGMFKVQFRSEGSMRTTSENTPFDNTFTPERLGRSLWRWASYWSHHERKRYSTWQEFKRQSILSCTPRVTCRHHLCEETSTLTLELKGRIIPGTLANFLDPEKHSRATFAKFARRHSPFALASANLDMLDVRPRSAPVAPPPGMALPLRRHQLESLGFMLDAEKSERCIADQLWIRLVGGGWCDPLWTTQIHESPCVVEGVRGGFLADAIGMGKTAEIIALCLANPPDQEFADSAATHKSRSTLVICPPSLLHQWTAEIQRFAAGRLRVLPYHGKARKTTDLDTLLHEYDIVLTSYNTFVDAAKKAIDSVPFNDITWHRVVYDESHTMSETCARNAPASRFAWLVSATPVTNFARQITALGWQADINRYRDFSNDTWPNYVLSSIMCRHSEREGVALEPYTETYVPVHATVEERALYLAVRAKAKEHANNTIATMNAIRALRAICSGGTYDSDALLRCIRASSRMTDASLQPPEDDVCPVCMDTFERPTVTQCNHWFCAECIETSLEFRPNCPMCRRPNKRARLRYAAPPPDEPSTIARPVECGSKCAALLRTLETFPKGTKTLVFASNACSLQYASAALERENISSVVLEGAVAPSKRAELLDAFRRDPDISVCFLTFRCAAVGLNITEASAVVFLDVSFNPEMTRQAVGRAWRQGQMGKVAVYHLVTQGTLEDGVYQHIKENEVRPSNAHIMSIM